jgi:O-antigen ligase
MSDVFANSNTSVRARPRARKLDLRIVTGFSVAVIAGAVATIYPFAALIGLGILAALGVCWVLLLYFRHSSLELWQVFVLTAISGYMLLNYGFENLAFHIGGLPIIISYGMMYGSFVMAVVSYRHWIPLALREPAIVTMLALLALACFHLLIDLPSYGVWAIRDASMCIDGLFLIVGLFWAMKTNAASFLPKWLIVLFIANMFYSFTQPWGEKFWSWSPESGVFLPVPILGNFAGSGDVLTAGALFCICMGDHILSRPRWLMPLLTMAQLLGLAIAQVRRMYLALVVVVILLALMGEVKKFGRLFILLPAAILVLFLATTVGGLQITGRIGQVNINFFKDHIRSITGDKDTPGSDPESRVIMASQAMQHFYAHPIIGEGFGQPLTDVIDMNNGAITRMPHNTTVSYLARLGLVGLALWIVFHFCLIKRFVFALRQRKTFEDQRLASFVLWLLLYYMIVMIDSLVEGPFEFPSGAVPFYFFMGFALGVIRLYFSGKSRSAQPSAALAATT